MAETDQKSVTIGDILDQLVKPSVVQSPVNPPPTIQDKVKPPPSITPNTGTPSDIKLPQLGKRIDPSADLKMDNKPEIKLSIRTMATDLATLKRGQKPIGLEMKKSPIPEIKKDISTSKQPAIPQASGQLSPGRPPAAPQASKPSLPPLPSRPSIPSGLSPLRPSVTKPLMPPLSTSKTILPPAEEHHHSETIISTDNLPAFLGAPLPKKTYKPDEKVEYGLIARVVSSGMTTGIVSTIVMAIVAYFLLSYFLLNQEEVIPTPIPTQIPSVSPSEINELDNIFKNVSTVNLSLSQDNSQNVQLLRSFVSDQTLAEKEFRRVKITMPAQTNPTLTFTDLLTSLSISYPAALKDAVRDNKMILLYGQEIALSETSGVTPKRIVFIVEIIDPTRTAEIMMGWENSLPNDLRNVFEIDPAKEATKNFMSNERDGITIRYKNFPLPDKSVDYAIASSLAGRHYLMITSSRESMFSPLDKLRGL